MSRGTVSLFCLLTAFAAMSGPSADASPLGPGARVGEVLDSAPLTRTLPRPLPFFYDLYTFRGDTPESTTVIAAFAVPVERLQRESANDEVRYRFDVSLVLSDTERPGVIRRDDSVYVGVSRPLSGKHLLFTHLEVQAPPSVSALQRVIMTDASTPGIGQLYSSPFPVPDYSGSQMMLSDLAMGHPNALGGWTRRDNTLALLPTSQFPGSAFDLYYEIYNLPFGNRYTTEILIEPVDDSGAPLVGGGGAVRTGFAGEAAPGRYGSQDELRHVEASLGIGRYRLLVTVTDQDTGETATQSRFFEVRGGGRGATMVPALPAYRMPPRRAR